nr:zinc finger, CCHC-type [Tanacetum cinerariifolium]
MDVAAMKHMASNFAMLDKFEGVDFRRWQKNIHFLLSSMSVVYVMTTHILDDGNNAIVDQIRKKAKWDNDDYVCRGLILNDVLADIKADATAVEVVADMDVEAEVDVGIGMEVDVKVDIEDEDEGEPESGDRCTIEVGVDVVAGIDILDGMLIPDVVEHFEQVKEVVQDIYGHVMEIPLQRFEGVDFRRWQKNIHFLLSSMSVVYVMTTHILDDGDNAIVDQIKKKAKWDNDDYVCRGLILNGIYYYLFDIYQNVKSSKELWDSLEAKYMAKDASSKKFLDSDKPKGNNVVGPSVVNMVEHNNSSKYNDNKVAINLITESRDVIFNENIFSLVPRPSLSIPKGTEDIGGSVVPKVVIDKKEAINDEMDSIMGNNTWVLADLPPGCKPLGYKWIFKRKLKIDRTIEKFKARLVIQGFKQKSDYFDTYASVARISTIKLLIAMALIYNLVIHQMDVKTAFLNGDLDEEFYMNQPWGFIVLGNENKVCKLIKSLYGLKKAPKQWHQKFDELVLSNSYLLNRAEKYVYNKFDESGKGVTICLYVDEMLIFGTDQFQVNLTKKFLSSKFSMKDMGEVDVILGIRIKHESNEIAISKSYYIKNVLKKFNYFDCTPASKKQTCISGSTMGSEFVALAAAGKEAEWLKNLLLDISLWSKPIAHISICCDSAATLTKAYSQMYNEKPRHLGVKHSMIRELITNGVISIEFVRSQQNLVDHLTKGLARDLVIKSTEGMGLKSN